MNKNYIFEKTEQLSRKYKTRDPFELLDYLHVVVFETDRYKTLKGYCFLSCRTMYVAINNSLSDAEKRIVAAHELGHIILHRQQLKLAPMKDTLLYDMTSSMEYEANLFAADLILEDHLIEELSRNEDADYFAMCQALYVTPDFMSFKLFSLIKRGHTYNMPLNLNSNFLAN